MSYSTILAVYPGDRVEHLMELRNSWGCAPVIWDAMSKRYLPGKNWLLDADRLWPLWKEKDIPFHHRACLVMTFDRAYVSKENYQRAARDIRAFLADFPVAPEHVNHWPQIVQLYESAPAFPAIGIYQTSVSENPFEAWDEEGDCPKSIDWSTAYDVYEYLEATQ